MPSSGTPAHSVFNGIINLSGSASYNNSAYGWYYQVTFSGLDPAKTYEFVTTANRGSSYNPERWSKFSIVGADAYTNASSTGTIQISPDVVHLNGGANTAAGDVVRWTGIAAADGIFTVRSENLLDINGKPYGYGMQAFALSELEGVVVPEPASLVVWSLLGLTTGGLGWRRRKRLA